jgi:hypothetical protein
MPAFLKVELSIFGVLIITIFALSWASIKFKKTIKIMTPSLPLQKLNQMF